MLRTLLFVALIVCLVVPAATEAVPEEILPAGTLLRCTLEEPNFSSRTAAIGDPVLCHLSGLATFGRSVFPRGAYLSGRFQEYRDPGRFFGKGWIELAFDRFVLPGAVTLPLSAKVISAPRVRVDRDGKIQGRGHPKRDALGWAVPVLWPVKVLTLPARGPRPGLKGEVRITLRLLEDVEVPATVISSRTISSIPGAARLRPSGIGMFLPRMWASSSSTVAVAGSMSTAILEKEQAKTTSVDFADDALGQPLTLLALRGGSGYLAKDYWLEAGRFHYLTPDGEEKLLPLERLDLEETVRFNRERKVEFVLRTPKARQP